MVEGYVQNDWLIVGGRFFKIVNHL